ncbi:MAG: hypothetical protein CMG66_03695 [Candidatus Marinimicrobia bacterium]|nr:hypothetical protein [Candidatus Neomarinimicrobiota bacterium]|tara:strand:- start:20285 stop:21502 length:1218 start_codon:yes stop_codon:yes gene_type:complete
MEIIFYLFLIVLIVSIPISLHYFKKPNHNASIKDLYAEGLDMLVMGKRKKAYKNFKLIIDKDSNNIKAYLYLGRVVRDGGNPKKALEIHQSLIHRKDINNYDKVELYKNLSLDYYKMSNIDQSIHFAKKILILEKHNEWSINHLIKLCKLNDNWEDAAKYLKILFEINNHQDNTKLALYKIQQGRVLLKNNEFNLSREKFEDSFSIDENLSICYYFIGNAFADESNAIYDQAIKLDSEIEGSLEKNEQSQKLKVDAEHILAKAITMWGHFIENMPEYSWMILPTLKDALQALHRYDDIEKLLIQTGDKNQDNLDIVSHLADFYANKGDVDKALKTINKALEKNKDSLIAQLKKLKIICLKNKESSLSVQIDKLIVSLMRDQRYLKYKQSYNDQNMRWLFESNNIK